MTVVAALLTVASVTTFDMTDAAWSTLLLLVSVTGQLYLQTAQRRQ